MKFTSEDKIRFYQDKKLIKSLEAAVGSVDPIFGFSIGRLLLVNRDATTDTLPIAKEGLTVTEIMEWLMEAALKAESSGAKTTPILFVAVVNGYHITSAL
jgi:hypothetical protein